MHPEAILEGGQGLGPAFDLPRFSRHLDELGPTGRLDTIFRLSGQEMAKLYEAAKGFRPLTLAALVPDEVPPLTAVVHEGENSLAMFRRFQKHFCKPADFDEASPVLYGLNRQSTSGLTGPGYFVARPSQSEDGALDIDYQTIPAAKPAGWPELVDNRRGGLISGIVFGGLVDVVRSISEHVTIGREFRKGRAIDRYFVLGRTDSAS